MSNADLAADTRRSESVWTSTILMIYSSEYWRLWGRWSDCRHADVFHIKQTNSSLNAVRCYDEYTSHRVWSGDVVEEVQEVFMRRCIKPLLSWTYIYILIIPGLLYTISTRIYIWNVLCERLHLNTRAWKYSHVKRKKNGLWASWPAAFIRLNWFQICDFNSIKQMKTENLLNMWW